MSFWAIPMRWRRGFRCPIQAGWPPETACRPLWIEPSWNSSNAMPSRSGGMAAPGARKCGSHADAIPWWDAFEHWMRRTDRQFWLLDLTHDLGIPVAAAISCDAHGRDLSFGFASGRSRVEAATSALGELVQFDLTKRLQAENALHPAHLLSWCRAVAVEDHAFLCPDPLARGVAAAKPDPIQPQRYLACRTQSSLHRIASARQGAHVVRAIVPGLRPIWPRFAPGRLYDVPFQLGWHGYKLTESELNPVPILY